MRLTLFSASCLVATIVAVAMPVSAAEEQRGPASKVAAAAAHTWSFAGNANVIFKEIQQDAWQAENHADRLKSFAFEPRESWETYADELSALKQEVNDMGGKLYDLEMNRRTCAPWQRAEIDRIRTTIQLMADNTQDAIAFGNTHASELWLPTYEDYTRNLYNEALTLEQSVSQAVRYAHTSQQYQNLQQELKVPASS